MVILQKIMRINFQLMELGIFKLTYLIRLFAMEDTLISEGMIFKANHNLFKVCKQYF